ncbi:hypothetical protein L211DRAFT_875427 [Terfezia boudieri ATCC MYA-4762]|uniref:Uncharacterized protein n=1 Tax=Terfezia boudieri ATCC MYA-4762 TaxID=1051890 RepID=A0A3N4LRZ7_9PEZI|nr:hypothetical protein L211DRAFT_875427 [Terfezia boudieri ATCC MYA-4762]
MAFYNEQQVAYQQNAWWLQFPNTFLHSIPLWNHTCSFCHTQLLNNERNGWCCNRGTLIAHLSPFLPLPTSFENLCYNSDINFSWLSRRINSLYAFTAIGTTGEFIHFTGISNVAVTGRIYHRLLDLHTNTHSLHWFLYDEDGRLKVATNQSIPKWIIDLLSSTFYLVNPYIRVLKSAFQTIEDPHASFAIELSSPTQGGDLAALIHAVNLTHIESRKIVIFHNADLQPQFISILSEHYEALQYLLAIKTSVNLLKSCLILCLLSLLLLDARRF